MKTTVLVADRSRHLATLYSQLCGVLAGFAFAGFLIYLAAPASSTPAEDATVPPEAAPLSNSVAGSPFFSFVSLVILAVLFALLSGDPEEHATAGLLLYGLPFGLAIVALIYTLTLMATDRPELADSVWAGRWLVVAVGPAVVLARLSLAASYLTDHFINADRSPHKLGLILAGFLLFVGIVLAAWSALASTWLHRLDTAAAGVSLGCAVVAIVWYSLIARRPRSPTFQMRWWSPHAYLIGSFVVLVGFAMLAAAMLVPTR